MSSVRLINHGERKDNHYQRRDGIRASNTPMIRGLAGLLLVSLALGGCGGGDDNDVVPPSAGPPPAPPVPPPMAGPPPAPPVPPPIAEGWHGRFVGTVKIGQVDYFGDALLTVDGAVRLYVGGPHGADGTVQQTKPAGSMQYVGNFYLFEGQALGSGVVFGQGCAETEDFRFCDGSRSGGLSFAVVSGNLQGEIQVPTYEEIEVWNLELTTWDNYYGLPAAHDFVAGQYLEKLAEFALDDDTLMSIDAAGQLFFQSAHSGCTGNGTLAPHLDGAFNVYDVILSMANCSAPYEHLNGGFEGLATTSPSARWDYDSFLRVWISRQGVALTLLGRPVSPTSLGPR